MRATNDFTVPDNLLGLAGADERSRLDASASLPGSAVTYTLRFYTGDKMGSGLTTPDAGVQVMLISADGRAFMQRVDRYPDVGEADANLALYSSPRFNRGDVDEVSFASPDLGCPAAIWIAPEAGGEWFLEEVELSCSEGSSMALAAAADADHARFAAPDSETGDRHHWVSFPCRERLGDVGSEALELRPSAFIKMTAEQRAAMRAEGLREYGELKLKMLAATGAAVVLGCAVTAASSRNSGDFEALRAFAAGGGVGMTYLWMLTLSIDTLGGGSAPPRAPGTPTESLPRRASVGSSSTPSWARRRAARCVCSCSAPRARSGATTWRRTPSTRTCTTATRSRRCWGSSRTRRASSSRGSRARTGGTGRPSRRSRPSRWTRADPTNTRPSEEAGDEGE